MIFSYSNLKGFAEMRDKHILSENHFHSILQSGGMKMWALLKVLQMQFFLSFTNSKKYILKK